MQNEKKINVAIIGAGASGLFLAKLLSDYKLFNITVFEKNNKVGTKIKASGGGKANIFNTQITPIAYNNPIFIQKLLQQVTIENIRHSFEQMGLRLAVDDENRVYPATFSSQSVLDVLLLNLSSQVKIITDFEVKKITKIENKFKINNFECNFDYLVLASGSPAGTKASKRATYNLYLNDLSLKKQAFQPSLVGFRLQAYPKILSGCRVKTKLSLLHNNKLIFSEFGEVTFKEDGVSGIVVLNASAWYNRLKNKENCFLSFDFLYDDNYDLSKHWEQHHDFCGILAPKLNQLYKTKPFDIRNFRLKIISVYDLEFAQVASGGIDLSEIDEHFQVKNIPNMYIVGEMLDIDAVCGGYNLFFAFSSAYLTAQSIVNHGNKD